MINKWQEAWTVSTKRTWTSYLLNSYEHFDWKVVISVSLTLKILCDKKLSVS